MVTTELRKGEAWAAQLVLLINFLFFWKYGARVVPAAPLFALVAVLGQVLFFNNFIYRRTLGLIPSGWLFGGTVLCWAAVAVAAHRYVPLETLNVDRWSVIDGFLGAWARGEYPYAARSHMGNPPGPMPVYYLLAYPFWRAGWLEGLSLLGPVAGLWWVRDRVPRSRFGNAWLLLFATTPWIIWEVLVRSNVLTYSVLVLLGLAYWCHALSGASRLKWLAAAAGTGLLLATRSVFGLAYVLVYGWQLFAPGRRWEAIASAVVALSAFAMTIFPFLFTWPEAFHRMNPFLVQSGFLIPPWMVLLFFGAAFGALAAPAVRKRPFFSAGCLLFGIVAVYALYHVVVAGWGEAFHGSRIDLSYFLFSVPFLVYGAVEEWGERVPSGIRSNTATRS